MRYALILIGKTANKWSSFTRHATVGRNCANAIHTNRNIGIIAHIDAGKTTTTEQMLYLAGEISNVGRVDSGDTVMDFLPQERERGITISSATTSFKWKNCRINLIDTPGHVDFTMEVERCVRVIDGAVVIIDSVAGVQAQTRTVWRQAKKRNIPAILFINKMDRSGASFERAIASVKEKLLVNPIAIQIPIGEEDTYSGVIDLISMKKLIWENRSSRAPSPPMISSVGKDDPLYNKATLARFRMIENMAEIDDQLTDIYLNNLDSSIEINCEKFLNILSSDDLLLSLRRICHQSLGLPTLCGASLRGLGVEPLLDSIHTFLPSPKDCPAAIARNRKRNVEANIAPDSEHLAALAFKVEYDINRGTMVFLRIFAGQLVLKQQLHNSNKGVVERPTHILRVSANNMSPMEQADSGSVVCVLGLRSTVTGDTLVVNKGPLHGFELEGLTLPVAVYSQSVEPEKSSQQSELEEALRILCLEDPSLQVELDGESGQTIIRGIGELHLEIICDKLRRRFNIEVHRGKAYVAYRESVLSEFDGKEINYVYDRTLGTKHMFAEVKLRVNTSGKVDECIIGVEEGVRESLRSEEFTSVVEGLQAALSRGPRGYPVVGLTLTVIEVRKDTNTSPGSIRACIAVLVDQLLRGDFQLLLEPVMLVEIDTPSQYVGDLLSDITVTRRAVVKDVQSFDMRSKIIAEAPLAGMLGYATSLRSATQGEGTFSMEYLDHVPVDPTVISSL